MPPSKNDAEIFCLLYKQAYRLCFGAELSQTITETESKLFYQQILERTGLTIGWRSLKNYSFFVLNRNENKTENPSIATLDTLARYVLNAPYTNEIKRKAEEDHHPYWFRYREQTLAGYPKVILAQRKYNWAIVAVVITLAAIGAWLILGRHASANFNDRFTSNGLKALKASGWSVQNIEPQYLSRQMKSPGLTLFTLAGDNWPDSAVAPGIKNLLFRPLPENCFTAEIHIENFIPSGRWQQAGLLLMEDADINSQGMRVSLAYNDFFGGYNEPREVLVQGISVPGKGRKPEEFAHYTILPLDSVRQNKALSQNFSHTALRIEKQQNLYRILYSGGQKSNMAFKLVASQQLTFTPRFIGIFALKGFEPATPVVPVHISQFILEQHNCK